MNSSVYIFGDLSSGYTQYPDEESSSSIFQKFHILAKAITQITIRRDGNLMYYAYIRKLEQDKYIGLCVLLNGVVLTQFDRLFSLFENVISNLVVRGYLIKYSENGNLVANTGHLYMNREEIDLITEALKAGLDNMQSTSMRLPPINYAVSRESVMEFAVEDAEKEIIKSSYTSGYTIVYKSKGFNTALMDSYQGVLSKLSNENDSLKKENKSLKDENKKIQRQKKQVLYVVLLLIAVFGCLICLSSLNGTLNTTQSQLKAANDSIESKNNAIVDLRSQVNNLQSSLLTEQNTRKSIEKQYKDFNNTISEFMPILIKDIEIGNVDINGNTVTAYGKTIYSSNTMYLSPRITYTGLNKDESLTLYVKLFVNGSLSTSPSSPYGYSYTHSFTISGGENKTIVIAGWGSSVKGNWREGAYRFEFWHNNVCLKAKTFTIY